MTEIESKEQEKRNERMKEVNKMNDRKKTIRRTGTIPWQLLDQLAGEQKRFENEKSYVEFNMKF